MANICPRNQVEESINTSIPYETIGIDDEFEAQHHEHERNVKAILEQTKLFRKENELLHSQLFEQQTYLHPKLSIQAPSPYEPPKDKVQSDLNLTQHAMHGPTVTLNSVSLLPSHSHDQSEEGYKCYSSKSPMTTSSQFCAWILML